MLRYSGKSQYEDRFEDKRLLAESKFGLQKEEPDVKDPNAFERMAEEDPESFWGKKSENRKEDLRLPDVETDASANLDQRHLDMPSDASISSLRYDLQA